MVSSAACTGAVPALSRIEPLLLRTAAISGLLGGLLMFFLMAGYNASGGMGFLTILNVCFAAWVFRGTAMTAAMRAPAGTMHHGAMGTHHETMGMHHAMGTATMMNETLSASHVIVGGLLHLGMSAFAGVTFAVVLAVLMRAGLRVLATPAGYVAAAAAGGALLYVVMLYGFAPLWNTEIVNFTPRVPFFFSHLLFGAAVGGWVFWRLGDARAGMGVRPHRPRLGSAQ